MYKSAGGKKLPLPLEVRWNSITDSLQAYLDNWSKLLVVCEEHRENIDRDITKLVHDLALKRNAQDYLERMKPIAVALDRMQTADCTIGDAVYIWRTLENDLRPVLNAADMRKVSKRAEANLTPDHYLAYLITPKYKGEMLSDSQLNMIYEHLATVNGEFLPILMKYQAKSAPFMPFRFLDTVIKELHPLAWWNVINGVDPLFKKYITKLLTAINSSASIERVFSTFGLVHSKLRNRLGVEKGGKLVFIYRLLNTVTLCD